jgi:hypothetical protein
MLRMNFRTISPQFPHFWHWHRGDSFEQRGVVTGGIKRTFSEKLQKKSFFSGKEISDFARPPAPLSEFSVKKTVFLCLP